MGELERVLLTEYEAPRVEDLDGIGEEIAEPEVSLPEALLERLIASV
jgi:hypothetical protein